MSTSSGFVLFVGNLPHHVNSEMLINILRLGLPHLKSRVVTGKTFSSVDHSQASCFVEFTDHDAASQCMDFLYGREFCGNTVKVSWAGEKESKEGTTPRVLSTRVTIFVGDLDPEIDDDELRQAFEVFGEVIFSQVNRNPETNESRRYGFVSFTNQKAADEAIHHMHGMPLKGKVIRCQPAAEKSKPIREKLDYDEVLKETDESNVTVFVTSLPNGMPENMLEEHFQDFGGTMVGHPRVYEADNGNKWAFIRYSTHEECANAIVKGHGSELMGRVLKCAWSTSKRIAETGDKRKYDPSKYLCSPAKRNTNQQPIPREKLPETEEDVDPTKPKRKRSVVTTTPPSKPTDFYPSGKLGMSEFMQYSYYCQYWMQYYQMVHQQQQMQQQQKDEQQEQTVE